MAKGEIGAWRTHTGRAEYLAAYDAVMATLPKPFRTDDLETDYGTVRSYGFGPTDATGTPILLLPGWGAGAPMWRENLPTLMTERVVFAFDALGDAGMSIQTAPLDSVSAQAAWIDQALTGLAVERAHVVGHSFGAWSATNFVFHHPARAVTLGLLDPVQTFSGLRLKVILQSIPSALPFLPQSWRDKALAGIGGVDEIDPNDPMTRLISAGTQHYVSKRSYPSRFTAEQLKTISAPVFVALAGESSVVAKPDRAAEFARANLSTADVSVWDGATHSLPMEQPEAIGQALRSFMEQHESPE